MRTYYIFCINNEMSILAKDNPYILFRSFESIYKGKRNDLYVASNLFEQLTNRVDNKINDKLKQKFKDNDYYMYTLNRHAYYNKYKDEKCELLVKNAYLLCTTNSIKPVLLSKLKKNNLFICDFQNKDYFWLDEIYC